MASFFSKYPVLLYNNIKATDILSRVALRQNYSDKVELYYEYALKHGDTPEVVAWKYYGDAEKHWLVLFANEIIDPVFEFPLGDQEFITYLDSKYSGHTVNNGYFDVYGNWVDKFVEIRGSEYAQITLNDLPFRYKITTTTKAIQLDRNTQADSTNYELGKEYVEIAYVGAYTGGQGSWGIGIGSGATTTQTIEFSKLFPANQLYPRDISSGGPIEKIYVLDGITIQLTRTVSDVTIFDWEQELNERKRTIKLIKKEYADQFEQELKSLLSIKYV